MTNTRIDPNSIWPITWWEYVRGDGKALMYGTPDEHGVSSPVMRNLATGELSDKLPVGAAYAIDRPKDRGPDKYPRTGYDGLAISIVCADGRHFNCEGVASNCTKKGEATHRCWVRHGTVGEKLTLDKNGNTCGAGAGSFFMGDNNEWHGFIDNGFVTYQRGKGI